MPVRRPSPNQNTLSAFALAAMSLPSITPLRPSIMVTTTDCSVKAFPAGFELYIGSFLRCAYVFPSMQSVRILMRQSP